jgi:DNA-binding response OmpR family regulator
MPFKVLIIDDRINDRLYELSRLKLLLEEQHFEVEATADGNGAYDVVFAFNPDVIVLDISFENQGIDGIQICDEIRLGGCQVPIILITKVYTKTEDIVRGLETGANDYVCMPCDMRVIRARIVANLPPQTEEYNDYLRIDFDSQRVCVKRDGKWTEVVLQPLQFKLLRALAVKLGLVVSYTNLAFEVWDKDDMEEGAIYRCLCALRAQVEPDPRNPIFLETIRGVGIRLNGQVTSAHKGRAIRRAPC